MKTRFGAALVAVVLTVGVVSCDRPEESGPTQPDASVTPVDDVGATMRLTELARQLARALADSSVRHAFHRAMATSDVAEGKVHLRSYLEDVGQPMLARTAETGGLPQAAVLRTLGELPLPVEVYLPVPSHREAWEGGEEVLVAAQFDENDPIFATDLQGRTVELSIAEAPDIPTILVVPAESFDAAGRPLPGAARVRSTGFGRDEVSPLDHCDPSTITCEHEDEGGGFSWSPPSGATWQRDIGIRERASHMRTSNDHEPWNRGAPEFVLYIAGTDDTNSDAELEHDVPIPSDGWSGSDDDENAEWNFFDPLNLWDLDVDYGTRIKFKCLEHDPSTSHITLSVSGSTTIYGVNVEFTAQRQGEEGGSDDPCGSYNLLVRTSEGDWTLIPDGDPETAPPVYDGTSELQWYGYGISLTS